MSDTSVEIRKRMRANTLPSEYEVVKRLLMEADLNQAQRQDISEKAAKLVREIRQDEDAGLMESFLAEYGLSTDEGIALMCLAEALLRVPDAETIDTLIEDKIAPSDWGQHLGQSSSSLVNASTWALLLTGKVLSDGSNSVFGVLHGVVKRLGEPLIRTAVTQAMREMGRQFVLGQDMSEAMEEAKKFEDRGFTYSYDMLGEAARTEADAKRYHLAYSNAIGSLASACNSDDIRENPGISVKLSALHPRYEFQKRSRVMDELVPRTRSLALLAKSAGMGFNIDAEEADRLDLSLDIIESVLADPSLKDWDGFGVVVQAYGPRAGHVIDWLYEMAERLDRKIMIRLVKGAYWDTEIKLAQTLGLSGYPVFTRKAFTDVSYVANARKLLDMADRIYPQFATHNAHTVCSILEMADDKRSFEFQRLHGMGEALHAKILQANGTRCRIYAPVGAHRDLLAYLVRRLLENGANSSFVNQIVDQDVAPEKVVADPLQEAETFLQEKSSPIIELPTKLYAPQRTNSVGWNLADLSDWERIEKARDKFRHCQWRSEPILADDSQFERAELQILNPADPSDKVGFVVEASIELVEKAAEQARQWNDVSTADERADVLNKVADLYEANFGELFALLTREAGKTPLDCVAELREAVDFLRYYAAQAIESPRLKPRGIFACISPWNFPLAIFAGQIAAALAVGNAVLAKPAEATPLIAHRAVQLLHEAGVPKESLQFLPGQGAVAGAALSSSSLVGGVCFTGSTATAQRINRSMADNLSPDAPLIAETGGLNAMIVDSTALPEQAVRDIIASAFQSAGQRCSALRVLYLQNDVAEGILEMLQGAVEELAIGNPRQLSCDVGPVIDTVAKQRIERHIAKAKQDGRLIMQREVPEVGHFVGPTIIKVDSILDLEEEIFGPVLHVATFEADEIGKIIKDINETGFGLTFGLHTRIDDRVQYVVDRVKAGNIYVNRNQIGAVVGSQPFGGEGLSGTGPKAGGPGYLSAFGVCSAPPEDIIKLEQEGQNLEVSVADLSSALTTAKTTFRETVFETVDLPGPTGESNRLSIVSKGIILCLGPGKELSKRQAEFARSHGCAGLIVKDWASTDFAFLETLENVEGVCFFGIQEQLRKVRSALASRNGPIIPLITDLTIERSFRLERHVCVDTTASGGNAALLAAQ